MTKSLLSIAAASMFLVSTGLVFAQGESPSGATPNWNPNQGAMMMQYSTTQKYTSFKDPAFKPMVGMELPASVTLYELPDTMKSPTSSRFRYGMVNDHPVVVESNSRKIVHTWD